MPSDYPTKSEEVQLSEMERILNDLSDQVNRLYESTEKSYKIAENLRSEEVSPSKGENAEDIPRGIIDKYRKVVDSLNGANNRLAQNLSRIADITGK